MNKILAFLIMTLLIASGVQALTLGQIRSEETLFGGELLMHVNVLNEDNKDRDGVHINVWIPALDVYERTRSLDIDSGDRQGRFVFLPGEDLRYGSFWALVTATDGVHSDSRWIILTI
jgi:hypothetical protein